MPVPSSTHTLPLVAGIGLRSPHMREVVERAPSVGWLEVHAENFMARGTAPSALEKIRTSYALSVHGVGLSLGSARGIDLAHLDRLKEVCRRFEPAMVSEHLSWSVGNGIYLNDLLPVPHDDEALDIVADNIQHMQDALKRPILIENLATYVGFAKSTMEEPEFLAALVKRTGCGLLLDINNVFVSARNMGFDPEAFIAALPAAAIGEIHLAGHAENQTPDGPVLIDSHDSRVSHQVWSLYASAIRRIGKRPTLIEWDADLPSLCVLLGEAMWADLLAGTVAFNELPQKKVTRDGSSPSNCTVNMAAIQDGHAKTRNHSYTEGFHA
jgi:uncharacterized protein